MNEESVKEIILKQIEDNQGIDYLELREMLKKEHNLSCDMIASSIQHLEEEQKVKIIKLDNAKCCYLNGNTKSNHQFYKENRPIQQKGVFNFAIVVVFLVLLTIALAIVFPAIAYFGVILLIVWCFLTWLFKR